MTLRSATAPFSPLAEAQRSIGGKGRRRPPAWLGLIGGATAMGVVFGAQIYYASLAAEKPVGWAQALYWSFRDWYEWALLCPVIFWLCRRFRFEDGAWRLSVPVFALAAIACTVGHALMCASAAWLLCVVSDGGNIDILAYTRELLADRSPFNLAVFAMIACAWHAWDYCRRFRAREARLAEVEQQLAQAQLFALRMQLNPHFLFNALNAVSSLMLRDVRAANQMLVKLGALLREVLENAEETEISLGREMELAAKYLEIEQVRFGDRLAVVTRLPDGLREVAVPPFILQPILENALWHALAHRSSGGAVEVSAARDGAAVYLRVADNGSDQPKTTSSSPARDRVSIGLNNTRQRLEKLYGREQWLRIEANAQGGSTVEIRLPFNRQPA